MTSRASTLLPVLSLLVCAVPGTDAGDDHSVDPRRFPKLVRLLLLPEERALLDVTRDDDQRRELQEVFWSRRDPTPLTGENELLTNARAVWKRADDLFSRPGEKGSETGCGQVLLLLGRPEEVRGLDTGARFDNMAHVREGARQAETWVYRDRPGRPFTFTRAELLIAFDSECRFAEGGIVADDLRRAAAALVTRPEITYRQGVEGRHARLAEPPGTAVLDLLSQPRSDFPLALETKLVTRGPKGEVFLAGLARIPPGPEPSAPERVSLAFRAARPNGENAVSGARESRLATTADGSRVASWDLTLAPGRYQVTVAAFLAETGQGSTSSFGVDVPDLSGTASIAASPLVLYPDEAAAPSALPADPRDPYAAFRVGPARLQPRFGNVFAPRDALLVVGMIFGAKVDPATGQAALRSRFTILKDGKPVASGAEDAFSTRDAVASVGPIPLSTYPAGSYVVRLDATDGVTKQTLRQEATFEIRAAAMP